MEDKEKDLERNSECVSSFSLEKSLQEIPKIKPRAYFRLKVAVVTRLAAFVPSSRQVKRSERRASLKKALQYAAAVVLGIFIASILVGGLNVAARETKPGDTLYIVKLAGEKLGLAFTLGEGEKAKKKIEFAQRRLTELEELANSGKLKESDLVYFAEKLTEAEAVARNLESLELKNEEKAEISKMLARLEKTKENASQKIQDLEREGNVLEPASGARVKVWDPSGKMKINGGSSTIGKADKGGHFGFELWTNEEASDSDLQVLIELDGRKEALPLKESSKVDIQIGEGYRLSIKPAMDVLQKGKEETFYLSLEPNDPSQSVMGKIVRLWDASGEAIICGQKSSANITVDENGKAEVKIEKRGHTLSVSRIMAEVKGDTKELMRLGMLDVPAEIGAPEGFGVEVKPSLENLPPGKNKVTLSIRKKYVRLGDYL